MFLFPSNQIQVEPMLKIETTIFRLLQILSETYNLFMSTRARSRKGKKPDEEKKDKKESDEEGIFELTTTNFGSCRGQRQQYLYFFRWSFKVWWEI